MRSDPCSEDSLRAFLNSFEIDNFAYRDLLYELEMDCWEKDKIIAGTHLYERIYTYIENRVHILDSSGNKEKPRRIWFDYRFGWGVLGPSQISYLGKLIPSSKSFLHVGECSYLAGFNYIWGEGLLSIGRYCAIGNGNIFYTSDDSHPEKTLIPINIYRNPRVAMFGLDFLKPVYENRFTEKIKNSGLSIGHGCWIGRSCKLKSNLTIANGAYIGEGSYVNKNLTVLYSLYIGIPCRFIRKRLSESEILSVEAAQWWRYNPANVPDEPRILDLFENKFSIF